MPLLLGKLLVLSVATAVTVGIAYALGTILHEIEESDERQSRDLDALRRGRPA
jgi:hypothetical protein